MKKIIFSLMLILFASTSFAQYNVYARMFGITNGQPQKLVVETTGEVVTFDRTGRITSYAIGTDELRYSWDGSRITIAAYQGGNKLAEDYMTVTTNTSHEVVISLPGATVKEVYRANGSESQSIISSNGQSMVEQCYYNSDSDVAPYRITLSADGDSETSDFSGYQYDAEGNWIVRTIKVNGQSQIEIRTITYYQ